MQQEKGIRLSPVIRRLVYHPDVTFMADWTLKSIVVWTCLSFIRSVQNHLARRSERGKKTRQTEEEVGRQHQGLDRPEVRQVPEGSGE